jgi:hypothetical protein
VRKKISLLSLALCSTTAFASATTTTSATNINLTLPHSRSGYEFSLAAVWLKVGASNLN